MKPEHTIKFTKTAIDALPIPTDGPVNYGDKSAPTGLRMRITPGGARTWYWFGRINGQVKSVKIGDHADVTADRAKIRAREINGDAAAGVDPNAEKRAAREGATLADLWSHYWTSYAQPHKKPRSAAEDDRNWKNHLEPWGKGKRLAEISRADVKTLHTRIGKDHPTCANRVLVLLSGMFSKAGEDLGVDARDNPARGIERYTEKQRDRVLGADELKRIMAALENADDSTRDFIKVALFTGARKSNVAGMRWEDLNLKQATWKIPGEVTKNGEPLVVTLAEPVLAILNAGPDHSPYVFAAMRVLPEQVEQARALAAEGKTTREIAKAVKLSQSQVCRVLQPAYSADEPRPMTPPKDTWAEVLKAAGIKGRTTLHDLRRTFCTMMLQAGASLTVAAAAMGHKDIRTTERHYSWVNAETKKKATVAAVAGIMSAATPAVKPNDKAAATGAA